jgi:hypothetical protein
VQHDLDLEVQQLFRGRLPDGWFTEPAEVCIDREEILVIGRLAPVEGAGDDRARQAGAAGRAKRFREETRAQRVAIAEEAEHLYGRKVAWGVEIDDDRYLFTHLAVPVMTRLRFRERSVLDTLIDGGIARSRSEALAWCVRLVDRHQGDWIEQLRDAVSHVERARATGPDLT